MSAECFRHVQIVRDLFDEVYFLNAAIEAGDIVSPKAALPRARKAVDYARAALKGDGLVPQYLEAYVAAGGWIGISYSYAFPDGVIAQGTTCPRPVR